MKRAFSCGASILLTILCVLSLGRARGQSLPDLERKLERLQAYPDLIVVNGKISTMDAQLTQAQAMAVKNSRILALGSNDEIRFLAGPKTEVLDAKGRTVLPGLIDVHTHPHAQAIQHWLGAEGDFTSKKYNDPQLKIVLAKGKDQIEVLRSLERVVRQRAQELGPGKWILVQLFGGTGTLYESEQIVWPLLRSQSRGGGTVSTELLDTMAPNNPLMVFGSERVGGSEHNSKAKELMMKYIGGEVFSYTQGNAVVYNILFRGRTEEKLDFLRRELVECLAAQGITTFGDNYYYVPPIMQVYNMLSQRDEMPVRWAWWIGDIGYSTIQAIRDTAFPEGRYSDYASFFYSDLGDFRGIGNDYLWHAGVAYEGWDGELSCTNAKPLNPSGRGPGVRPDCNAAKIDYEKNGSYRAMRAALHHGLRIGFMHASSDGTFHAIFHMIEQAMAEGYLTLEQVRALRLTTEHSPLIRPDQIAKIAQYGIRPNFAAYMLPEERKGGAFLKAYGERYMTWMAPMKSLVEAGVHPVFGTDAHLSKGPVEWRDMNFPAEWDGNFWAHLEFFATRMMPDGETYNKAEAVDKPTIMKAATIWAAEHLLNEKNIGSLEVGKLADFIVIDKDYFSIPDNQIHSIKTLLTAVGGKTVYKAPTY